VPAQSDYPGRPAIAYAEDFEKALVFAEGLQSKFDQLDLLRQGTVAIFSLSFTCALLMVGLAIFGADSHRIFYFQGLAVAIFLSVIFGLWETRLEQRCKRERSSLIQVSRMLHEIKNVYDFSPIEQVLYRSRLARLEFGSDEPKAGPSS
jgi:hypothetical protein